MIKNSKLKNYSLYAIGEIILVVVGILVALQINNANEARKGERKKTQYINSLLSVLKQDSITLESQIGFMQWDLDINLNYAKRLSSPEANN